jgi:hypothetical protein
MSIRLFLAEMYLPVFMRKRELKVLFALTAAAFGRTAPSLTGLSLDECLIEFARFTKTCVDEMGDREEGDDTVQERLFQKALEYGKLWRKRFGVTTPSDVMRAGRILYRAIGIDFRGTDRGFIDISECFFSRFYSPATCRVISSLDAGIMAGLSAGNLLSFTQRITEGCDSCKGQMTMKDSAI